MSLGGHVTLIQSVLSAIPIYCLSFYSIPKKTIKEITSIQRNFLWGGCEDINKIPWVSWEDICKDKGKGGLGIRELGQFNLALLSKWVWRFLNDPGRLWARIIISKYGGFVMVSRERSRGLGPRRSEVGCGSISSWWKDICEIYKGSGVIKDFIRVVGNGNDTSFWSDTWLDDGLLKTKFNRLYRVSEQREYKVGEMGIKLHQDGTDSWRWIYSSNGVFSTSIAYKKLEEQVAGISSGTADNKAFERLWSSYSPKRQQTIVWKVLKERMPTRDKLRRRGIIQENGDTSCAFCREEEESLSHVFFQCKFSYGIWCKFFKWLNLTTTLHKSPIINFMHHGECLGPAKLLDVCLLFGLEWCGVYGNVGTS
ncbi:hypothetical protein ACS0TY_012704 [Phlomoides rotata]